MGFNEIRINKTRSDSEIEEIVNSLVQTIEFRYMVETLKLSSYLFEGLIKLKRGAMNDYEQAMEDRDSPPEYFWPEGEKEIRIEQLADCAWAHFSNHISEKLRIALVEMIQESQAFAYSVYQQRCGRSEEEINEARPMLDDLQQNVLRWSILRLKGLPYQLREGVDGEENNEALSPWARAGAQILNHLAFWTYDPMSVNERLNEAVLRLPVNRKISELEAKVVAREATEFIWDNIDGGMQAMVEILVSFSLRLAYPSLSQRHPENLSKAEKEKSATTASTLEDIARVWLRQWFDVLSVSLNRTGGSEPVVEVTDDDCREYAQRYRNLLSAIQDATDHYKKAASGEYWHCLSKEMDSGIVNPTDIIRGRFGNRLSHDAIIQIGIKTPERIALFEAARGSKLHGYKKRSLEEFRARGNRLLKSN